MSSQSKQQRVSPVRNRLPFSASMSFTLQQDKVNVKLMKLYSLQFCEGYLVTYLMFESSPLSSTHLVRMAVIAFLLVSSLFSSMCLNFEYTFSIFLFTS